MAVIHRTTLTPSKMDLLHTWLPAQPWYLGSAEPRLSKAGGFRLDDPAGEVGIEFMAATDTSGDRPYTYHIPFAYRGAPLEGAEHALIGTAEHGVLGPRWFYDGAQDPVVMGQLIALVLGAAEPQAQSTSNTPDPTVTRSFSDDGYLGALTAGEVRDGPDGTDHLVHSVPGDDSSGAPARRLTVRVNRVLLPHDADTQGAPVLGHVTAGWIGPDETTVRGRYAVVLDGWPDHA